jgi:hypothetical protein
VVLVEAKGGTSSKAESNRYGREFSSSQVFTHVAKAFFTAAKLFSQNQPSKTLVAIAFPDTPRHRSQVQAASAAFARLGITVWLVEDSGQVKDAVQHTLAD